MVEKEDYPVEDIQATGWVIIELKDEQGDPVPSERYVITLPSGEDKEGKLDEKGYAKIEGIPKEGCNVRFPDIDDYNLKS